MVQVGIMGQDAPLLSATNQAKRAGWPWRCLGLAVTVAATENQNLHLVGIAQFI